MTELHRTADNLMLRLAGRSIAGPRLRTAFQVRPTEDVAGRAWTIAFATKPSFEAGSNHRYLKYTIIVGTYC